jgi:hypothetical protein
MEGFTQAVAGGVGCRGSRHRCPKRFTGWAASQRTQASSTKS